MSTNENIEISVVIPFYRSDELLDELFERLSKALNLINKPFEVIIVDDSNSDKSWYSLKDKINSVSENYIGIRLSRNFGQHNAIFVGLENASGQWIVVMDCDLQDLPEDIERLYNAIEKDIDIVYASRKINNSSFRRNLLSNIFYMLLNLLNKDLSYVNKGNFGIYSKAVIQNILKFTESKKFFPIMVKWTGFNSKSIHTSRGVSRNKKSSYTFYKLLALSLDAIIFSSNKPIKLIIFLGLSISVISAFVSIWYFLTSFYKTDLLLGWTSTIISIWFLSGIILTVLGIMSVYIANIYDEVKNRPISIIKEIIKK
jgi:glycosyltransferase involved in cell wall biosynthesis